MTMRTRRRLLLVLWAALVASPRTGAAQLCIGDCNRSYDVEVTELVLGVNVALERRPVSACRALANGRGAVDVTQLVTSVQNALHGCPTTVAIERPGAGFLVLAGTVAVQIHLPPGAALASVAVALDGVDVTDRLITSTDYVSGSLAEVAAGTHTLRASTEVEGTPLSDEVRFDTVALTNPDECEVLNAVDCLMPYPSARFLVADASASTGFHVEIPAEGLPVQNGAHLDPATYTTLDGFSPVGPVLMHFPGGVDVAASNASRLSPVTRTYDARSLDADSPTVLLDADTGERILHFVELDARATPSPERRVLYLHPGKSLTPGHRYIVAVRHLVRLDGDPATAEPAFAALRDRRPTEIAGIEVRRDAFEQIFRRLKDDGIGRDDLILAFDFVVQSDTSMTAEMLSMRDQAFAWLAERLDDGARTFTVTTTQDFDCTAPNTFVGRKINGTFQSPLFLTADPVTAAAVASRLHRSDDGAPEPAGITNPPFAFAIPCTALRNGGMALPAYVLGHGGGESARILVDTLIEAANTDVPYSKWPELVVAATDYTGATLRDVLNYWPVVFGDLNLWPSIVDRERQGAVNQLIFTRMVKEGIFNADPAFRASSGIGILTGPEQETFFAGRSITGGAAVVFGALSPDVQRVVLQAPGSITLFIERYFGFAYLAGLMNLSEPLELAVTLRLLIDVAARGDAPGYATHVTTNPLPGVNPKQVLVLLALHDQEISNLNVELLARTFGIPSLEGSVLRALPQIPDRPGPLASALMVADIGAADLGNPAHEPFIPPLENLPAACSLCDPHGIAATQVPVLADQQIGFLQPGGMIESFCTGLCDGAEPAERAYNWPTRCDPFDPWFVPFDFCS